MGARNASTYGHALDWVSTEVVVSAAADCCCAGCAKRAAQGVVLAHDAHEVQAITCDQHVMRMLCAPALGSAFL